MPIGAQFNVFVFIRVHSWPIDFSVRRPGRQAGWGAKWVRSAGRERFRFLRVGPPKWVRLVILAPLPAPKQNQPLTPQRHFTERSQFRAASNRRGSVRILTNSLQKPRADPRQS